MSDPPKRFDRMMVQMPDPAECRRCGEALQAPVRFCPFCGIAQTAAAAAADAIPVAAPNGPAAAAPPAPPPAAPIEPPARPEPPAQPAQAARHPIVPPVSPSPPPASRWGAFPVRVVPVTRRRRRWFAPAPAARADAVRKLLLAALILGCAAVLWRHLTAAPHSTLVVHLTRPVDGTVLVDGVPSGGADQLIAVEAGRHEVGFAATGWDTVPVAVALRDGATRTVSLSPSPRRASLRLDSVPPGAGLSLNNRWIGHAPATLSLPPGSYRLGAVLPGYAPDRQLLALAPGEQRSLGLALRPLPVRTLHLSAPPAGAWSDPVALPPHARVTLLFGGAIRVRVGGRVVLLDGGAPASLGSLAGALSFTAAGEDPVPVVLLLRSVGAPG